MKQARLMLDEASLNRFPTSGKVYGNLWLVLDESCFPERDWSDFPVVVLSWWCNALADLLNGAPELEVPFMDGPFRVHLRRLAPDRWHARLLEGRLAAIRLHGEEDIAPAALIESTLHAAAQALAFCGDRPWWTADAQALDAGIQKLRQSLVRA